MVSKIGLLIFIVGLVVGFASALLLSQTVLIISVILTASGWAFVTINAIVII